MSAATQDREATYVDGSFEALYAAEATAMSRLAYLLVGSPEQAQELVHDAFDGIVQGAYLPCSWFEGVVWVNIALDRPAADFTTAEHTDPYQLVIDVSA